jgi:putative ABC transport system permease protein
MLGATMPGIAAMLSKDFLGLVVVAFVIASRSDYTMSQWLLEFAYRIELGPGTFLQVGIAAVLTTFLTVSYQSIRAARIDPAKSLRYE